MTTTASAAEQVEALRDGPCCLGGEAMSGMPCGGDAIQGRSRSCRGCLMLSKDGFLFTSEMPVDLSGGWETSLYGKCLGPLGPSILEKLKAGELECAE